MVKPHTSTTARQCLGSAYQQWLPRASSSHTFSQPVHDWIKLLIHSQPAGESPWARASSREAAASSHITAHRLRSPHQERTPALTSASSSASGAAAASDGKGAASPATKIRLKVWKFRALHTPRLFNELQTFPHQSLTQIPLTQRSWEMHGSLNDQLAPLRVATINKSFTAVFNNFLAWKQDSFNDANHMFQLPALFLTYQYVLVVLTVRQLFFPVQV